MFSDFNLLYYRLVSEVESQQSTFTCITVLPCIITGMPDSYAPFMCTASAMAGTDISITSGGAYGCYVC